jgi:hypothetical protein
MQHACYRCSAPVEDGTPFCKQCNAPQIKVVASEPLLPQEVLEPHPQPLQRLTDDAPARSRSIEWRNALPSIFFIAVPAGLLSVSGPLGLLFFVWAFGAGAIGVSTYRKRTRGSVTLGMAARLGFLSGAVGYTVILIIFLAAMSRPDFPKTLREQMRAQIDRTLANNPDPGAKQLADMLSSPNGMATILTASMALFAFLFFICSILGALAGATIFAPKNRAP